MTLSPASDADTIIAWLEGRRNVANLVGMARFGIRTERALGIPNAELRPLARVIGRNHDRAARLWDSGIREARLLAAFTDEPKKVTERQARTWAADCDSWELVDTAAALFVDAGLAFSLIPELVRDEREFVRRTGFAMIAWASVHLKKTPDADILGFLPLIEAGASDSRNFVTKAVSWALRQIGKRNLACHGPALALARRLADSTDRTERRIGRDAARELTAETTLAQMARRARI